MSKVVSEGVTEHRSSRAPALRYGRRGGDAHRAVHVDRVRTSSWSRSHAIRQPTSPRAGAIDRSSYGYTPVPDGLAEAERYIEWLLADRDRGAVVPFAQRRLDTGELVGCTRYLELRHWRGRTAPDEVEIGGTWLASTAQRTAVNTEAKLLLLTHAFEQWEVWRVAICTDALNQTQPRRDRAARRPVRGHPALASAREPAGRDPTPRHRRLLDHQRRVAGRAGRAGRPARTSRRMSAAGRPAISAGMSQLDVSSNSPSRLTGSPIHHCVDVAAPPRLNAAPSTAGAPCGNGADDDRRRGRRRRRRRGPPARPTRSRRSTATRSAVRWSTARWSTVRRGRPVGTREGGRR